MIKLKDILLEGSVATWIDRDGTDVGDGYSHRDAAEDYSSQHGWNLHGDQAILKLVELGILYVRGQTEKMWNMVRILIFQ